MFYRNVNQEENWAIVNSEGKIIEKFRLSSTAKRWKNYIKKSYPDELNIQRV